MTRHMLLCTARIIGVLVAVALLWTIYWAFAHTVAHNADNATALLEAHAMLAGNSLLRGWHLPADTFLTSDLPVYALSEWIAGGIRPILMTLVPSLLFTAVTVLCLLLAAWGKRGAERVMAILLTLAVVGTPGAFLANEALLGPIHMGTIMLVLLCVVLYLLLQERRHAPVITGILLTLLLLVSAAALVGDPLTLSIEPVPLLILGAVALYQQRTIRSLDALLVGVLAMAFVLSSLVTRYLVHTSTAIAPSVFVFVSADHLYNNVVQTLSSVLLLFSANFFGQPLFAKAMLRTLLHLGLCGAALGSLILLWRQLARGGVAFLLRYRLEALLFLAALINLFSFLLSTFPGGDITNARYLLPFFFCSGILAGRMLTPLLVRDRLTLALSLLVLLAVLGLFGRDVLLTPPAPQPEQHVVALLRTHGLSAGYGGYWASSILTVAAQGRIQVRAVIPANGQMRPDLFLSDAAWYRGVGQDRRFVVTSDFYTPPGFVAAAVQAFGPYAHSYTILPYHIYLWEKSLPQIK